MSAGAPDEPGFVLDASALLAFLHDEPGGEAAEGRLHASAMSTVNWSEVVQKSLEKGVAVAGLQQELEALGLRLLPFTTAQAERAAALREVTRPAGLSLGDRACLALAAELGLPAVTMDRAWKDLPVGVEVHVAR